MIVLRPDQLELKRGIYGGWNNGAKRVLAVLPTGGGKSVIVSDIVEEKNRLGACQCIIAHRVELVGQMSMHVAQRGVKHRIIAPKKVVSQIIAKHRKEFNGRSFINPDANCTVAGVDTLLARKDELSRWAAQIDDWTIDEAHHVLRENKWGRAVAMFPNACGLGVTATPQRADGMGLGSHHDGVFDAMVIGPGMRDLINIGALCDYQIAQPPSDFHVDEGDFNALGELSPAKGRLASERSHIIGDVVNEYIKHAFGKRGIAFVTDVKTAGEIAAKFNAFGIPAAAVSAETPSEVRDDYIERFRDGRLWVLVNVDLFGEGFDVPAVEVVMMARPTASLAVYLQQFGRALRILFGKIYGLVIDHVGNFKRHGFPDQLFYWTLDRREKRAKPSDDPELIDMRSCRSCSRPYERFRSFCPYCLADPPLPDPSARTIEQVDGDLILLDMAQLAAMRAATVLESPAAVGARVEAAAGPLAGAGAVNRAIERHASQERLCFAIAQWAAIQRAKGRDDRETHKRFYIATGVDVLTAQTLSRGDMDALAIKITEWWSK